MSRSGTENRQMTCRITARFNEQEAENIRRMADRSGLSVGALVRRALLNSQPPRAMRRPSVDHKAVARVLGQLGKIGSNINQIAKHANAGRSMDRMDNTLEMALRDLSELRLACMQALGFEQGADEPPDSDPETPDPSD